MTGSVLKGGKYATKIHQCELLNEVGGALSQQIPSHNPVKGKCTIVPKKYHCADFTHRAFVRHLPCVPPHVHSQGPNLQVSQ